MLSILSLTSKSIRNPLNSRWRNEFPSCQYFVCYVGTLGRECASSFVYLFPVKAQIFFDWTAEYEGIINIIVSYGWVSVHWTLMLSLIFSICLFAESSYFYSHILWILCHGFFLCCIERRCNVGNSEDSCCLWLQDCWRCLDPPVEAVWHRWQQGHLKRLHPRNKSWPSGVWGEWGLSNWHCFKHWGWKATLFPSRRRWFWPFGPPIISHLHLKPKLLDEKQTAIYKREELSLENEGITIYL